MFNTDDKSSVISAFKLTVSMVYRRNTKLLAEVATNGNWWYPSLQKCYNTQISTKHQALPT